MLVKTLIKRLQKMDPNLPVVEWNCQIENGLPIFGFNEYSKIRIIRLEKKSKTKGQYIETSESNKKAIKAVYLFGWPD